MEESGMTDLQFKSFLKQLMHGIEAARNAGTKEETQHRLDGLLKDLKEDLHS